MTEKQRFPLGVALAVAHDLRVMLEPSCERIEIAGSIRRGRLDVGDIELLYIPKTSIETDMFGNVTKVHDAIDSVLSVYLQDGSMVKRKNSAGHNIGYGKDNKFLVHQFSGIPLDIFATSVENWGMAMVVRTGPKDFNVRLMDRFQDLGMRGHAYGGVSIHRLNDEIGDYWESLDCPTEEDVFRLAQWDYIEPEARR